MPSNLLTYGDFNLKAQHYGHCLVIDTAAQLHGVLTALRAEPSYVFRGVNNAAFMMYSSAQRYWLNDVQGNAAYPDYRTFVRRMITRTATSAIVSSYLDTQTDPQGHPLQRTDMLHLALMQHYLAPSPLLDFTHDLDRALFFATDGASTPAGNDITDYISVIYANGARDWLDSDLQKVMETGATDADRLLRDFCAKNNVAPSVNMLSQQALNDFEKLDFEQFFEPRSNVSFIVVPGRQFTSPIIACISKQWHYYITSPRLAMQEGFFIMNTSADEPLEQRVKATLKFTEPLFSCINIHKSLVPQIRATYLDRRALDHFHLYCEGDHTSRQLQDEINRLYFKQNNNKSLIF